MAWTPTTSEAFLLPLAVLVLCWAARNRIRNAEGTLSGLAFTSWGVRLTVVVALSYLAYYGFTFFAVRLQAQDYADKFFEQLKQGHSDRAFLLATGIPPQEDDASLRDTLEVRYNSPMGQRAPGPFTQFRQSQFVRAIEMSGAETRVEPKGVIEWGYENHGYRVLLKYLISTPMTEFDMSVDAFGRDSKPGEPKGRQWQILMQKGETRVLPPSVKPTALGKDFMKKASVAQNFAMLWEEKIARQEWDEVYLDTLEPAQRERLSKGRKTADVLLTAPLAGLAPLGLCDAACRDFLDGRHKLAEGKLIHLDDKKFWTSKIDRAAIVQRRCQRSKKRTCRNLGRPICWLVVSEATPASDTAAPQRYGRRERHRRPPPEGGDLGQAAQRRQHGRARRRQARRMRHRPGASDGADDGRIQPAFPDAGAGARPGLSPPAGHRLPQGRQPFRGTPAG